MKRIWSIFFTFLCVGTYPAIARQWPEVVPVDISVGINFGAEKEFLHVPIFDMNGIIVYNLTCRGIKETYLDTLPLNYVGPWMCVFNEGNKEIEGTLLNDQAVAPWHGRGQFFQDELLGVCGEYPEFGRMRHFRLRGFVMTLAFRDLEIHGGRIDYGVFQVSVRPDATARSKYAEPPNLLDPFRAGGSCDILSKNHERK